MALEEELIIKTKTGLGIKGMAAMMAVTEEELVENAGEVNRVTADHEKVISDIVETDELLESLRRAGKTPTEKKEQSERIGSLG